MKIQPVESSFFHTDGQTGKQEEAKTHFSQFSECD